MDGGITLKESVTKHKLEKLCVDDDVSVTGETRDTLCLSSCECITLE